MAIDESKKRQKAGTPPNSLTRQPKNKKKEEDRRKDGDNTRKDFFPEKEAASTYKTCCKNENVRKIEERTMQASTPHTAKKQAASTNTAADLSKTLEIQIREAKQTVAKMEEEQPQYIQEMQQQLLSLQENVQKLEKNTENLRRDLTDVDILNGTQQDKRRKGMAERLLR